MEKFSQGVLIPGFSVSAWTEGPSHGLDKNSLVLEMEMLEAGSQPEHTDMVGWKKYMWGTDDVWYKLP